MNLRISSRELRVRVDQDEARRLAAGERLAEKLPLGGFEFEVQAQPIAGKGIVVEYRTGGFCFVVDRDEVKALLENESARDAGIFGVLPGEAPVKIVFEIDLFSFRKKK